MCNGDVESKQYIPLSFQGYYRKAKVLQEMGQVDESLQVFLHCLALDENFCQAKHEVELVRYDVFMVNWWLLCFLRPFVLAHYDNLSG